MYWLLPRARADVSLHYEGCLLAYIDTYCIYTPHLDNSTYTYHLYIVFIDNTKEEKRVRRGGNIRAIYLHCWQRFPDLSRDS